MEPTDVPKHMAEWLFCLGCIVWIANQVIKLFATFRAPELVPPNAALGITAETLKERIVKLEEDMRQHSDAINKSIGEIWNAMRGEDASIRVELRQFARDIERAVGRLEGTVKQHQADRDNLNT